MLVAITICVFVATLVSPSIAIRGIGINLGNVLDAPYEGAWAPVAQEYYFDDYKKVGFDVIRIPVRWDEHTSENPPFAVNATFMARVQQIVGWCLTRGFVCIINSHHDDWLDAADFSSQLPRFVAIWTQVSATFSSAPENLFFEIYNEPHVMTLDNLNSMNSAIVPVIRKNNPTRPIYLGGLSWMSPYWILSNPNAMVFPQSNNLRLEVHTYDPYNVCLQNPPSQSNWGSAQDQAALLQLAQNIVDWSKQHNNIPIYLGELGCLRQQTNYTARVLWYKTMATAWKSSANIEMFTIWDDNGDYMVYDRAARTWDQQILAAIGL